MPHLIARDVWVELNGVDLSDHVRRAAWTERVETREVTGISDQYRAFAAGPKHGEAVIEWLADYHPAAVYRTLHPLLGKTARLEMQPHGGAHSASNPRHAASVLVTEVPVVSAALGQLSTLRTTWPLSGPVEAVPSPYWSAEMTVGAAGSLRGWRKPDPPHDGYGSLTSAVIAGDTVPGFTPTVGNTDIELTRIVYSNAITSPTPNFDFYLVSNDDADALHGHWLVAGPIVVHLDPSPGSNEFYRARVTDPGWSAGDIVNVELWNDDPR